MLHNTDGVHFIDTAYNAFVGKKLEAFENRRAKGQVASFLGKHKETIINQVFFNLGLNRQQKLNASDQERFVSELDKILPILGGLPSFFTNGDVLEKPAGDAEFEEKCKITARNYLRLFMRGSKVGTENDWVWNSPLFTKELYETIAVKGDPVLLRHVREQIQEYLDNAFRYVRSLSDSESKEDAAARSCAHQQAALFERHLFPLLASLAFFDYPGGAQVLIPVNMNGTWQQVKYTIQKLDLSPKPTDGGLDGIIGRLLQAPEEEENRFYMYGLNPDPESKAAHPILLLNGTPHPACPGEDLAVIHNFGVGKSIGETHNWSQIHGWVAGKKNVEVYCHSKGGSMGQILAAERPDEIACVKGLSSAGLHSTTLERLKNTRYGEEKLTWDERLSQRKAPRIELYQQPGDPVVELEQGFLEGTELHPVITNKEGYSLNAYPIPSFFSRIWEGHSLPSLGYKLVGILNGNWEQENKRELRSILDTAKGVKNYFASFEGKINLILKLCGKKMNRFINRNKKILTAILFGLTLAALISLIAVSTMGFGLLAPLMVGLAQWAGSQAAAVGIACGAALLTSGVLTYFKAIPSALRFVFDLGMAALGKVYSLFALTTILVLSTPSIIKNSAKALYKNPQPLKDFGKYLLRLQFIPDFILGVIKGIGKVGEAFYILAAGTAKYLSHKCTPAKPAVSRIHAGLGVDMLPNHNVCVDEENEFGPMANKKPAEPLRLEADSRDASAQPGNIIPSFSS